MCGKQEQVLTYVLEVKHAASGAWDPAPPAACSPQDYLLPIQPTGREARRKDKASREQLDQTLPATQSLHRTQLQGPSAFRVSQWKGQRMGRSISRIMNRFSEKQERDKTKLGSSGPFWKK